MALLLFTTHQSKCVKRNGGIYMVVRSFWEFDVDDTDGEILQQCVDIAKVELESQLKNGDLSAEDFHYEVRPDLPTVYQAPVSDV